MTCFTTVEACRTDDELRYVEGKESVPVEVSRVPLGQHEGLGDIPPVVNVAEVGSREEPVVAP